MSDLGLVGAQLELVKAVKAAGKPTIVVFVSGKPIAEPWIQQRKVQQVRLLPQANSYLKMLMPLFNNSIPVNLEVRYPTTSQYSLR
jgi:hypothetical protein